MQTENILVIITLSFDYMCATNVRAQRRISLLTPKFKSTFSIQKIFFDPKNSFKILLSNRVLKTKF